MFAKGGKVLLINVMAPTQSETINWTHRVADVQSLKVVPDIFFDAIGGIKRFAGLVSSNVQARSEIHSISPLF